MSGLDYYEIGDRQDFGEHTFTEDEIIAFARKYDPQPFHLDHDAAKDSVFGALCASGWHTGAMWMRKNCDFRERDFARLEAEGGTPPVQGPSPGLKNLSWHKPVFPGEPIRFGSEVTGKRELRSKPGWGVLETRNFAETLDGTPVMTFDSAVLIKL